MKRSLLSRFRRCEKGSLSVEAVLIFPILLWGYAALFIYWDAFKTQNLNLKASYTIADLVSRWQGGITPNFMSGVNDVFQFLIRSDDGNDVRISVVRMIEDPGDPGGDPIMELQWSEATGDYEGHADVSPIEDRLPMLPLGDELIVVETRMEWSPPFSFTLEYVGLGTQDFDTFVFTTKRTIGETCWDGDDDKVCDDTTS